MVVAESCFQALRICLAKFLYCSRLGRGGNVPLCMRNSFHICGRASALVRPERRFDSFEFNCSQEVGIALSADWKRPKSFPLNLASNSRLGKTGGELHRLLPQINTDAHRSF